MEIGLGKLIWHLSHIASIKNINLSDVASHNLQKIKSRWPGDKPKHTPLFDEDSKLEDFEKFPRILEVTFQNHNKKENGDDFTIVTCKGIQMGDRLTDNTYEETGYRFHDAIHYAFVAVLGWSPVMRSLFKLKRKSDPQKDEVEDGARAAIIEEAIVSLTYDYAEGQNLLEGQNEVDHSRIKIIQKLSKGLEVSQCQPWEWKKAILKGYEMFRLLKANKGGKLILDLEKRDIFYEKL